MTTCEVCGIKTREKLCLACHDWSLSPFKPLFIGGRGFSRYIKFYQEEVNAS